MADSIFLVDPETRQPLKVEPVSFSKIGIQERKDLEQWVVNHPDLLGEELLVITTEFDRFDKTDRRLDILALDLDGVLTIVELKLDANHSLADLQAIRYAAFCSTMKIDNIIVLFSEFRRISHEEASAKICEFLDVDELTELGNRPRIIIAAGSLNDCPELTSCVLWLSNFGVDISCVELTPYCLRGSSQIILVPRIIIPIPEAKEYLINVAQKEASEMQNEKHRSEYRKLWDAISEEFNKLGSIFQSNGKSFERSKQIRIGDSRIHYEWIHRKRDSRIDIGLHFESTDRGENFRFLELIRAKQDEIKQGMEIEFRAEPWGKKWASAEFCLPYYGNFPAIGIAPEAARIMKILIERTWPIIEPIVSEKNVTPT
jgi:hypothetical protein